MRPSAYRVCNPNPNFDHNHNPDPFDIIIDTLVAPSPGSDCTSCVFPMGFSMLFVFQLRAKNTSRRTEGQQDGRTDKSRNAPSQDGLITEIIEQ